MWWKLQIEKHLRLASSYYFIFFWNYAISEDSHWEEVSVSINIQVPFEYLFEYCCKNDRDKSSKNIESSQRQVYVGEVEYWYICDPDQTRVEESGKGIEGFRYETCIDIHNPKTEFSIKFNKGR